MSDDFWTDMLRDPEGSSWTVVYGEHKQWGLTHFCKKHSIRVRRTNWYRGMASDLGHECEMCSERPPEKLTGFLSLCEWGRE
jgi:hypothetical protein